MSKQGRGSLRREASAAAAEHNTLDRVIEYLAAGLLMVPGGVGGGVQERVARVRPVVDEAVRGAEQREDKHAEIADGQSAQVAIGGRFHRLAC